MNHFDSVQQDERSTVRKRPMKMASSASTAQGTPSVAEQQPNTGLVEVGGFEEDDEFEEFEEDGKSCGILSHS